MSIFAEWSTGKEFPASSTGGCAPDATASIFLPAPPGAGSAGGAVLAGPAPAGFAAAPPPGLINEGRGGGLFASTERSAPTQGFGKAPLPPEQTLRAGAPGVMGVAGGHGGDANAPRAAPPPVVADPKKKGSSEDVKSLLAQLSSLSAGKVPPPGVSELHVEGLDEAPANAFNELRDITHKLAALTVSPPDSPIQEADQRERVASDPENFRDAVVRETMRSLAQAR